MRRFVGVEQVWSYANTGYWLAGHLAARARGDDVRGRARRARPAAVRASRRPSFGEPDVAGTGPDARRGPYPRARRPSGGLVSTVADLLRFGRAAARASRRRRRCAIVHGKPVGGVYGLGLFGERVGGVEVWGHAGSYGGFQTLAPRHPGPRRGLRRPDERAAAARRRSTRSRTRSSSGVLGARRARCRRSSTCRRRRSTRYAGLVREQRRARTRSRSPPAGSSLHARRTRRSPRRRSASGRSRSPDGAARARALRLPARGLRRASAAGSPSACRDPAAVAAGHPATAEAGAEILADGGIAADAAVAACLASCVAETVMTGLLGGGHAIYFDAASGAARNSRLLRRRAVGRGRADGGAATCRSARSSSTTRSARRRARCPGVPAGPRRALARARTPAVGAARRAGAAARARRRRRCRPRTSSCLAMLAPVMTMREGAAIYAPGGALLEAGDVLRAAGARRGARARARRGRGVGLHGDDRGRAARARRRARRRGHCRADLEAYAPRWAEPVEVDVRGTPRADARRSQRRPRDARALRPGGRRPSRCSRRSTTTRPATGTRRTSRSSTPTGHACVLTTSLGLGSGDFLPGLDLHLNSMLGETDLIREPLRPGRADGEHDGADARLRRRRARARARRGRRDAPPHGARRRARRGPARRRSTPQAAIDRPRFHPAGELVNAEPGVDEACLAALEAPGRTVRRWPALPPLLRRRQRGRPARRRRRSAAKRRGRRRSGDRRGDPAQVTAAAGSPGSRAPSAVGRLDVRRAALQAADAIDVATTCSGSSIRRKTP